VGAIIPFRFVIVVIVVVVVAVVAVFLLLLQRLLFGYLFRRHLTLEHLPIIDFTVRFNKKFFFLINLLFI